MQTILTGLCLSILWLLAISATAGDLSSDVRKGTSDPHADESNYIEMGFSLGMLHTPFYGVPEDTDPHKTNYSFSLDLNLHLQYKGWFMESFSQSLEEFTLGYNFADGERWSLDAVSLEQHPEIGERQSSDLAGFKTRESDYMLGLRATRYYEKYIVQLHALTDMSDTHNGQVFSLKLARHWQYRNWNFHIIQSESYRTHRVADYYLSVAEQDASEKFPEFQAQAGFIHTLEVGATYPLSQKWVFRSSLRYVQLDSQWRNSPVIAADHGDFFVNSISYVF